MPPFHVSFALLPRFNMLTLTCMIDPMRIANYLSPSPLFQWSLVASTPGQVRASNGLEVTCAPLDAGGKTPGLIAVLASWGGEHINDPALFGWLRRRSRDRVPIAAVELGVYAVARAGLLNGRTATTHWSCMPGFAEAFPTIDVREQLYTVGTPVSTVSGGTAGMDFMLNLVATQSGEQLAAEIANQLLHHPRRPPDAMQRHAAGSKYDDAHPDVRAAMRLMEARIEEPVSVPDICSRLKVPQRTLERLFRRDTGCTIVQYGKLIRLQYARVLLSSTRMSIREVSVASGFNSMSYFSQSFVRTFGRKPSEYRLAWPENEPAPLWPGTVYDFIRNEQARQAKPPRPGSARPAPRERP